MSESSTTIPTQAIKVLPPHINTNAEATGKKGRQIASRETSDEVITSYSMEEGIWIETQSITRTTVSLQAVMAKESNISYGSLPRPPVCNANQFGNCIKPVDEDNRPCTVHNRCKRDNH